MWRCDSADDEMTEPEQAKPILVFYHVPGDGDEAL